MLSRKRSAISSAAMVLLWPALALSQPLPTDSEVYRLDEASSFQCGCFAPCRCPIMLAEGVRGTFRLTYEQSDWLFDYYTVTDVNWTVPFDDPELRVTGSGTYKIGGEFALTHQLELDLRVGNEAVQHFDSGLLVGGRGFPVIDIAISLNGMYCLDTVFEVVAAPVPRSDIVRYHLHDDITYQFGCWDPCDCPISEPTPLTGRFDLVLIAEEWFMQEFAVIDIDWQVLGANGASFPITGVGTYHIGGDFAFGQRMRLDLSVDGAVPEHFDSGFVMGSSSWPDIDLLLSINGLYCFDQAIDLHAGPLCPPVLANQTAKHLAAPLDNLSHRKR